MCPNVLTSTSGVFPCVDCERSCTIGSAVTFLAIGLTVLLMEEALEAFGPKEDWRERAENADGGEYMPGPGLAVRRNLSRSSASTKLSTSIVSVKEDDIRRRF